MIRWILAHRDVIASVSVGTLAFWATKGGMPWWFALTLLVVIICGLTEDRP